MFEQQILDLMMPKEDQAVTFLPGQDEQQTVALNELIYGARRGRHLAVDETEDLRVAGTPAAHFMSHAAGTATECAWRLELDIFANSWAAQRVEDRLVIIGFNINDHLRRIAIVDSIGVPNLGKPGHLMDLVDQKAALCQTWFRSLVVECLDQLAIMGGEDKRQARTVAEQCFQAAEHAVYPPGVEVKLN